MHLTRLLSASLCLLIFVLASDKDIQTDNAAEAEERRRPRPRIRRIWEPALGEPFQIVLSAQLDANPRNGPIVPEHVRIFDLDVFDNSRETIMQLKRMGKRVVCYFSAGTAEDWREDFQRIDPKLLGAQLPMWPGERWLDIRSKEVMRLMQTRIRYAARKGCDALDPDNVDGYENERGGGFNPPLTKGDSIKYVRRLSRYARRHGMSMGLKNALEILPNVERDVAFAVNEECVSDPDDGCEPYARFIRSDFRSRGKPVFHIEYVSRIATVGRRLEYPGKSSISTKFTNATSDAIRDYYCLRYQSRLGQKFSTVIKVLSLDGWVLMCDGSEFQTRGRNLEEWENGVKKGRGQARSTSDPDYAMALDNTAEEVDAVSDAQFELQLEQDLVGLNNTSLRKGAMKDRIPSPLYLSGYYGNDQSLGQVGLPQK